VTAFHVLHRANALAAREVADPELVGVLREVADLRTRHVAAEEVLFGGR
jgi:hypothetical protein